MALMDAQCGQTGEREGLMIVPGDGTITIFPDATGGAPVQFCFVCFFLFFAGRAVGGWPPVAIDGLGRWDSRESTCSALFLLNERYNLLTHFGS